MTGPRPESRHVILIVEDESGIREALELLLGLEGYEVIATTNGAQALDVLAQRECDLVITDHMMPVMDGLTLLSSIRANARLAKLPTIMMSAVSRPPHAMQPLADVFIGKPFEIPILLMSIQRLLKERAAPAE